MREYDSQELISSMKHASGQLQTSCVAVSAYSLNEIHHID